ncbi:uncharacterized protein LACBIDRAFT_324657 [Laccaria bicolor S238N-H82]|uniref:Predicted protein n=1 Tax=Laccaria bicolor (strain S238N-H82 / ATCC MYA-4686) TaxID=486041 RepID=B0D2M1_LACBS|nr:uncharacterized protein LACBIDRAFT_324657 [Laccaria bicolor S238N-H82]EDR10773.1 predicted protein [Laccaria bicolor S238N-H82]|eukprot:XP_001878074.1 predicted protein [Laccaria bicolor S238N-H82]
MAWVLLELLCWADNWQINTQHNDHIWLIIFSTYGCIMVRKGRHTHTDEENYTSSSSCPPCTLAMTDKDQENSHRPLQPTTITSRLTALANAHQGKAWALLPPHPTSAVST